LRKYGHVVGGRGACERSGINAPWWLLTHYPEVNDSFTWLDGLCILLYIGISALSVGGAILSGIWLAERIAGQRGILWRLVYCLIPLGGINIFLGLSMLTLAQLSAEGVHLAWAPQVRAALLLLAVGWNGWLMARTLSQLPIRGLRRTAACSMALAGVVPLVVLWSLQFYVW
jgi:hypothetical protein